MESHGLECVFSSDIDEDARLAYKENFGELPFGDITAIPAEDIPSHDVLCGGFPCQPFSNLGKRKGTDDDRGNLFLEICRIARHHKPAVLLLENVKGILSIDQGRAIKRIMLELQDCGYYTKIYPLNSMHFGIPQARERVYFVALREDSDLQHGRVLPTMKDVCVVDILDRDNAENDMLITHYRYEITNIQQFRQKKIVEVGTLPDMKMNYKKHVHSVHGVARTIINDKSAQEGINQTGLYLIDNKIRALNLTEMRRVMGFPDNSLCNAERKEKEARRQSIR